MSYERWQNERDDFDPEDINYCTFRWITTPSTFAMSGLRAHPITGEMIDGDVIFDASWIRAWKEEYAFLVGTPIPGAEHLDLEPLDVGEIIWFTLLQERVPDRLLGRVGALDNFASLGLVPVSMALAGPAGDTFGTRETLLWAGVAAATAIVAAFVLTPSLRRADAQPARA